MRRDTVIFFVPTSPDKDDIGNDILVDGTPRQVLAERKSVRQSEFYQASTTDFKPEIVFTVWTHEYQGESILIYQEKRYTIIRTFEKSFNELELVCEVRIGGD